MGTAQREKDHLSEEGTHPARFTCRPHPLRIIGFWAEVPITRPRRKGLLGGWPGNEAAGSGEGVLGRPLYLGEGATWAGGREADVWASVN